MTAKMDQHPELIELLKDTRSKRNFDVDSWIDKKTDMFNDYMRNCGLKAAVVSVSGGVDSACILGLAMKAMKKSNSPIKKVLGIAQPIKSTKSIWSRALECKETMGAEVIVVDQSDIFEQLAKRVQEASGINGSQFSDGQLKSYMRTPVGYYVAQLVSQEYPCVVLGTGNFDEDGYLCYFCKAGDGVVDVQLIADLHKSEVFHVAKAVNVPESILVAPPSADLWEGQTDEDELGFSYDYIELYTEYLQLDEEGKKAFRGKCSDETWAHFNGITDEIDKVHNRNKHKLNFPVNLNILKTLSS